MSNMSYCRFENTYRDFIDCVENIDNNDLSKSESIYREGIIKLCVKIALDYGHEVGRPVVYVK